MSESVEVLRPSPSARKPVNKERVKARALELKKALREHRGEPEITLLAAAHFAVRSSEGKKRRLLILGGK